VEHEEHTNAFSRYVPSWRDSGKEVPGKPGAVQRDFVVWIHTAKQPETRAKRIREAIRLLAAGRKLGLK